MKTTKPSKDLTAAERETVITFNDAETYAKVTTCQSSVINTLRQHPHANHKGVGVDLHYFEIPKRYISFPKIASRKK